MTKLRLIGAAALAAACLLAASTVRAQDIQPGLWQDTETGEVNGKAVPRKVTSNCVTPAEAKDIVKQAQAALQKSAKEQAQKCSKLDIRQTGNVVTFEIKCGDAKQGSIDATTVITIESPRHTVNVAKSSIEFLEQKMVSTITTDSKWVAAECKK